MLYHFLYYSGILFFFSSIAYTAIKTVRTSHKNLRLYTKRLSNGDLFYICIFSIVTGYAFSLSNIIVSFISLLATSILIFANCIDAGLCSKYNIYLNLSTLKMSCKNKSVMLDNSIQFIRSQIRIFSYMLSLILIVWLHYFSNISINGKIGLSAIFIAFSCLIITKSKVNWVTLALWILIAASIFTLISHGYHYRPVQKTIDYGFKTLGIVNIIYLIANVLFKLDKTSNIKSIFFADKLKAEKTKFSAKDQYFIDHYKQKFSPSHLHGKLTGCNVVLITFESLGLSHLKTFNPEKQDLPNTPFIEKLLANSIFSEKHLCLQPVTHDAIKNIYASNFMEKNMSQYIDKLNSENYKTCVIHMFNGEENRKIYQKAGLQNILLLKDIDSNAKGDYKIPDAISAIKKQAGNGKFFLHILNSNTHVNYKVINKTTYNRFSNKTDIGRFYNAIEECDKIFSDAIDKIYAFSPPEKTIIALVGDHGQSFGEFDYYGHSSAVINEQMRVPFLIYHPALQQQAIPFSTHHDIFPTLFDLLGYKISRENMGTSILSNSYSNYHAFLASSVRHGNTPACFGFEHDKTRYFVDLFNQRFYQLDENDKIIERLSGRKKSYVLSFLLHGLKTRGIISEC